MMLGTIVSFETRMPARSALADAGSIEIEPWIPSRETVRE